MLVKLPFAEKSYKKLGDELNKILAETYGLYIMTQGYHWNIEGKNFPQLHAAFQTQYEELSGAVDELAERVRVYGVRALGSVHEIAGKATLKAVKVMKERPMVDSLAKGHEKLSGLCETLRAQAVGAGDEALADIMIERLRAHQKFAWMLRASLK